VAGDFPVEENVFHLRSLADVVNHHVAPAPAGLLVDDDADVRHVPAQVPGNEVAGRIVFGTVRDGQGFSLPLEEDHQIRNTAVVDIRVRMSQQPAPLVWVGREILQHIFVDFFLQIDAHGAVGANNLISANSGIGGNVPAWIWNSDILRNVADGMVSALDGGGHQAARELLMRNRRGDLRLLRTRRAKSNR